MSLFKRCLNSVIRKPIKSVLLVAILYFISVLLLMAVGISQQQTVVQGEIKNQVGGSFRLELNREEAFKRAEPYTEFVEVFEGSGSEMGIGGSWFHTLNREDIEKLSNVEGIADINILSQALAFSPINFENDQTQASRGRHNSADDDVWLTGLLNAELLDEVSHGFIELKEGRWIEESDEGAEILPLVISEAIAKKNDLSLGDSLEFEWQDHELDAVLEHFDWEREEPIQMSGTIVGIFSVQRPMEVIQNLMSLENTIFTSLNFSDDVFAHVQEEDRFHTLYNLAIFDVADAADYDQIRENILNVDADWALYNLVDSDEMLSRLSSDLEGLHQVSTLMFSVVMVAGFGMLWLIFILWVRNRNHEIAILLAIGIEKTKIVSQFIFEALLVAVVAFSLAVITMPVASQWMDVGALSTQLQSQVGELDLASEEMGAVSSDTTDRVMTDDFYDLATSSVTMTAQSLLVVMLSLLGLISVSIMVAMVPVMNLKPREIFSKMN